jgi:hypothetical protein
MDPELLAAGILGDADCRRLMGLLAFGRWSQYIELAGAAEHAKLADEVRVGGAYKGPTHDDLLEIARDRQAAMATRLPLSAPDDFVLVSSQGILDAVVAEIQEARKWLPSATADPELGLKARRAVAAISETVVGELEPAGIAKAYLHDHMVSVAAAASAPLITEDSSLAPRESGFFEVTDLPTGRPAYSIRLWPFVDAYVNRYPFDLADVPEDLLDSGLLAPQET